MFQLVLVVGLALIGQLRGDQGGAEGQGELPGKGGQGGGSFPCCSEATVGGVPRACYVDPTCLDTPPGLFGGLGCNADGTADCRFCGWGEFFSIECPQGGSPPTPTSPPSPSSATGSPSTGGGDTCSALCNASEPCFLDPSCASGGLGCNAIGVQDCRFCGFSYFGPCPAGVGGKPSPSPPSPSPPSPTTGGDDSCSALCQAIKASEPCFLDPSCARGGLGCNAAGIGAECRFCGFGAFAPCPVPQTFAPAAAPTQAPVTATSPPTRAPMTVAPTKAPTAAPVAAPTSAPVAPPTRAPTTVAPTKAPTTVAPTAAPVAAPTSAPVAPPTRAPTTIAPTKAPTTAAPTAAPVAAPTSAPVPPPTSAPTTAAPTKAPTSTPAPVATTGPVVTPVTSSPIVSGPLVLLEDPTDPYSCPAGTGFNPHVFDCGGGEDPSRPIGGLRPSLYPRPFTKFASAIPGDRVAPPVFAALGDFEDTGLTCEFVSFEGREAIRGLVDRIVYWYTWDCNGEVDEDGQWYIEDMSVAEMLLGMQCVLLGPGCVPIEVGPATSPPVTAAPVVVVPTPAPVAEVPPRTLAPLAELEDPEDTDSCPTGTLYSEYVFDCGPLEDFERIGGVRPALNPGPLARVPLGPYFPEQVAPNYNDVADALDGGGTSVVCNFLRYRQVEDVFAGFAVEANFPGIWYTWECNGIEIEERSYFMPPGGGESQILIGMKCSLIGSGCYDDPDFRSSSS